MWSALVWIGSNEPPAFGTALIRCGQSVAGAGFLTAGALLVVLWRLTGQTRLLWNAVALIIVGLTVPLVSAAGVARQLSGAPDDIAPLARALLELTVLPLAGAALITDRGIVRMRTMRLLSPALLLCWVATVLSVLRRTDSDAPLSTHTWLFHVAAWLACGSWAALSAMHFWRARRGGTSIARWGATALALLSAGETLRVLMPDDVSAIGLSAGVQLAAGGLATSAAVVRLRREFARTDRMNLTLSRDLAAVRAELAADRRDQQERRHDIGGITLGLLGAARALAGPAVSPSDRRRLEQLMTSELHRMRTVLDPDPSGRPGPYRLADALRPVVLAHRLAGGEAHLTVDDSWSFGRPEVTATAVANLLANADRHAPGARVVVTARRTGQRTEVRIDDDGPGIPAAERDLVLQRGRSGSTTSPGRGLGLHTAARAMHEQGGGLELTERPGGGTRVSLTVRTFSA